MLSSGRGERANSPTRGCLPSESRGLSMMRMRLCVAFAVLLGLWGTGCGATASGSPSAPAGLSAISLVSGGHQRTYELYAPPGDTAQHRLPLVLVYHGAGDTAVNEATETNLLAIDRQRHDMILAYPQGYDDTWNEGAGNTPAHQAGINDVTFTSAMLHQIESQHFVEMDRVVATGISNGALLVELLGCQLAADLTLIAPVEGQLPVSVSSSCHPSEPVSVDEFHGTADTTIPYSGGHFDGVGGGTTVLSAPKSAARWASLDRCGKTPRSGRSGSITTSTYTGCTKKVIVTLATVKGGQHQWPPSFGQRLLAAMASLPAGRRAVSP